MEAIKEFFVEYFNNFDIRQLDLFTMIIRLVLATFIGGVIGIERGQQGRAAGMRTHILVCIGAALTTMLGLFAMDTFDLSSDPMRIGAQVISGIGFLGAGTILLKGRFQITGLTTAAGLWATAAVGLALGVGYYEGAIVTGIIAFLTFTIFHKFEYKAGKHQKRFGIYLEIDTDLDVKRILKHLTDVYGAYDMQVTAPRSAVAGNVGIEAVINNDKKELSPTRLSEELSEIKGVVFVIESI